MKWGKIVSSLKGKIQLILLFVILVETTFLSIIIVYNSNLILEGQHPISYTSLKSALMNYIKYKAQNIVRGSINSVDISELSIKNTGKYTVANFTAVLKTSTGTYKYAGTLYIFEDVIVDEYYSIEDIRFVRSNLRLSEIFSPERRKVSDIKLFIMAFCPFGNRAENTLLPFLENILDKITFEPVYIISKVDCNNPRAVNVGGECYSSLHGENELWQDVREKCVYNIYGFKKWKDFVLEINQKCNSNNIETCWVDIAKEIGLNVSLIEQCVNENGKEILEDEVILSKTFGVTASPTLIINNSTKIVGARSLDVYKDAICRSFIEPPDICK